MSNERTNRPIMTYAWLLEKTREAELKSAGQDAPCASMLNVSGYIQMRRLNELIEREKFDCPPNPQAYGLEFDRRSFSLTREEAAAATDLLYWAGYPRTWMEWRCEHFHKHPDCIMELVRVERNFSSDTWLNCYGNALILNPNEVIQNPWTVDLSTVFGGVTIAQWLEVQTRKHTERNVKSSELGIKELMQKRAYKALGPEGFKQRFGYDFIDAMVRQR